MEQRATPRILPVTARDETFRIVQLQGNLFVCTKDNGSCCCGWTEKGRAPINRSIYEQEWEGRKIRNKVHLTFTGCLGPCAVGNNAMLQIAGRSVWFKDLNDDSLIPYIFEYIETLLGDRTAPPPPELIDHIYSRYAPMPTDDIPEIVESTEAVDDSDALARLDPVCLMDVDPATARWAVEYEGQRYVFCAPACKKSFERDPLAYV